MDEDNPYPTLKDALKHSWHEFKISCATFYSDPFINETLAAMWTILICRTFGG